MKGKDLAFLTGGALLVYMLIPKKAAEAAAPGVSILGIPTAGEAPLDIGTLFGGMAEMFSGMLGAMPAPTQVLPQFISTQGEQGPSEWDLMQTFRDFTEGLDFGLTEEGVEKAIQDALNKFLPTEEQEPPPDGAPSLIPEMPDWLKNLLPGAAPGLSIAEQIIQGVAGRGAFDIMGELIGTRATGIGEEFIDMVAFFTGQPRPVREHLAITALTEAQFEIAGVDEVGSMEDIKKLQRVGEITGIREALGYVDPEEVPPIGSPDYIWYMSGKPRPVR